MGAYKNDYKKEEDYCLWELHEIRHRIREKYKGKNYKEINKKGLEIYNEIMKDKESKKLVKVS